MKLLCGDLCNECMANPVSYSKPLVLLPFPTGHSNNKITLLSEAPTAKQNTLNQNQSEYACCLQGINPNQIGREGSEQNEPYSTP